MCVSEFRGGNAGSRCTVPIRPRLLYRRYSTRVALGGRSGRRSSPAVRGGPYRRYWDTICDNRMTGAHTRTRHSCGAPPGALCPDCKAMIETNLAAHWTVDSAAATDTGTEFS